MEGRERQTGVVGENRSGRYITVCQPEFGMGLPAFREAEANLARSYALPRPTAAGLDSLVKRAEALLAREQVGIAGYINTLRATIPAEIHRGDKRALISLRLELFRHAQFVEGIFAERSAESASMRREIQEFDAEVSAGPGSSTARRFLRRLNKRMLRVLAAMDTSHQRYLDFLKTQYLAEIDGRLRQIAKNPPPFESGVADLIDRYPKVLEYLAR